MQIVLTWLGGHQSVGTGSLFRGDGAEVICLHDRPDGDRINVHCGSTHLGPLQTAVQQHWLLDYL